jgi:hypothetical protein
MTKHIDVKEAARLYENGMTLEQVGKILGVSLTTIYGRLLAAGVHIRTNSESKKGKPTPWMQGEKNHSYGKIPSEETKKAISEAQKGKSKPWMQGEKNPQYIDGRACDVYCQKWTNDFRANIREFFGQRCIICGKHQDEEDILLACHHVESDKQACCADGVWHFACLCKKCHGKTIPKAAKNRWMEMIIRAIDEMYGGRSYFPRDVWAQVKPYR